MKYRVMPWLIVCLSFPGVRAGAEPEQQSGQAFTSGNEAYEQSDLERAISLYLDAQAEGFNDAALYYNLGNAFYRTGEYPSAVLNFARARRLAPGNESIESNLALAQARVDGRMGHVQPPIWKQWLDQLLGRFGRSGLFAAGYVLYLAGTVLIGLGIWRGAFSVWLRRPLLVLAAPTIFLLGVSLFYAPDNEASVEGVIMQEPVRLHTTPATGSAVVRELRRGILVELLEQDAEWARIRLPNGQMGWIPSPALERV